MTMRESENESETECPARSAEAVSAAATACSIGEAFALAKGEDALVIIDDIDEHKIFWDWTTRVLVDIFGVDSVVKDDADGGASSETKLVDANIKSTLAKASDDSAAGQPLHQARDTRLLEQSQPPAGSWHPRARPRR